MRNRIGIIIICILFIGIAIPQIVFIDSVKADPGDVILSFNSPAYGPTGLAWDGQCLWNLAADYSLANSDIPHTVIYKIDSLDGSIITSFDGPGVSCVGLTWDGSFLWCSDNVYRKIYKLDPLDGRIITSFDSPGIMPMGLTWDGQYLWNADITQFPNKGVIYKLDPLDGTVITSFNSPDINTTGLAWDGQYLWNADITRYPDKGVIYKLDPLDGTVITSFNSPGIVPYGLTWDGEYLWNADIAGDTTYPKIYKIDVGGSSDSSFIGEISGGFGVKTSINNIGSTPLYDVNWSIDVEARFGLIIAGSHTSDVIDTLEAGDSQIIQVNNLRGIGLITITIQAADSEKQATAFLLGPLVLRVVEV